MCIRDRAKTHRESLTVALAALFARISKPHGVAFVRPAGHCDEFSVWRIAKVGKLARGEVSQLFLTGSGGRLFHPKILHAGSNIHKSNGDLARNPTRETKIGFKRLGKFEIGVRFNARLYICLLYTSPVYASAM